MSLCYDIIQQRILSEEIMKMYEMKDNKICNIEKINNKIIIVLCILYFIALIWVVIFKCNKNELLNLDFHQSISIKELFIHDIHQSMIKLLKIAVESGTYIEFLVVAFNIFGFIPIGISLRHFTNKSKTIIFSFLLVLCIEIFQLFSRIGGIQIADFICNTLGCIIGIIIYEKIFPKIKPQLINRIAIILICVGIPFDLYIIIRTVIHWPWL